MSARLAELDAAAWQITQAITQAERMADDRRHTNYRRQLAHKQAALGYGMLVLEAEWRRLDGLMYPESPADTVAVPDK